MAMASARRWLLWVAGTIGALPMSYLVWWWWGAGFCGEEAYDTPPGSTGDALCQALIRPVWPWALVAATPTLLAFVGGLLGLLLRRRLLFSFSLLAPVILGVLTFLLVPGLF